MIVLFTYILTYVMKLERTGCECAKDWRRDFIVAYSIIVIAFAAYDLAVIVFHKDPLSHVGLINMVRGPILLILGIIFVVATIQYVNRLKREKCACSEDTARLVLFIVAIIDAAVFAVAGLLLLSAAIAFLFRRF
jgi:hypothetical protein